MCFGFFGVVGFSLGKVSNFPMTPIILQVDIILGFESPRIVKQPRYGSFRRSLKFTCLFMCYKSISPKGDTSQIAFHITQIILRNANRERR